MKSISQPKQANSLPKISLSRPDVLQALSLPYFRPANSSMRKQHPYSTVKMYSEYVCVGTPFSVSCVANDRVASTYDRPFWARNFRWSTLLCFKAMKFTSSGPTQPELNLFSDHRTRPCFSCSGSDLLNRFMGMSTVISPSGPDEYMALSMCNWVSTKVLHVELAAIQREMETLIGADDLIPGLPQHNGGT